MGFKVTSRHNYIALKKILNSIKAQIQLKNSNMRSGISNKYKIKIINSKTILIRLPASLTHRVCKECI